MQPMALAYWEVMRTPGASFVLRRISSYRLVLGAALLTTIVTAGLTGALASFAAQALPQAVRHQIAAGATSIVVTGALNAELARRDNRAIIRSMRSAFGAVPIGIDSARWSDPLGLSGRAGGGIIPLIAAAAPQHIQAEAVLTAGAWPGRPAAGQPLDAAVPAAVARQLALSPGQVLALPSAAAAPPSTRCAGCPSGCGKGSSSRSAGGQVPARPPC
jgi:hypothetical protein